MGMIATLNLRTGAVALAEEGDGEEMHEDEVHAEEGHAEEDTVNPVIPNVYDMVWAFVFFAALWALMKFVLMPPIVSGRDARREKAQAAREAVSGSDDKLAAVQAAHDQKLAAAKAEAAQIIEGARAEVEADRRSKLDAVEAELAQQRAAATEQVLNARNAAMAGARGDVDALAVNAASSVLGKSLDVDAQRSVLDRILNG